MLWPGVQAFAVPCATPATLFPGLHLVSAHWGGITIPLLLEGSFSISNPLSLHLIPTSACLRK